MYGHELTGAFRARINRVTLVTIVAGFLAVMVTPAMVSSTVSVLFLVAASHAALRGFLDPAPILRAPVFTNLDEAAMLTLLGLTTGFLARAALTGVG